MMLRGFTPATRRTAGLCVLNTAPRPKMARLRLQVKQLSLFGSCARAEQTPSSDIDILVEFLLHQILRRDYAG